MVSNYMYILLVAEESYLFDRHVDAVLKNGKVVDHMPNELARVLLIKELDSSSVKQQTVFFLSSSIITFSYKAMS